MSNTIESLEIEIIGSSKSAEKALDALEKSLGKIKTAVKGGLGLTAATHQLEKLNGVLGSLKGSGGSNLTSLAKGLEALSKVSGLKLSSSLATQIANLGTATMSLVGVDFSRLTELASALTPLAAVGKANLSSTIRQLTELPAAIAPLTAMDMTGVKDKIRELVDAVKPLSEMAKANLGSTLNQIKKLPETFAALSGLDMAAFAAKIREVTDALKPLATEMEKISRGFSAFPDKIRRMLSSTGEIPAASGKAGTSFLNLAAKMGVVVTATKRVYSTVAQWIKKSNEYTENLNLFTVALGEYAEEAKKYAETVGEAMGLDPGEWMRNQGIFMTLATGFGIAGDRAHTMSQNLTQLGYDLSSFFNIGYEDAMLKLQSGLAGELEPLRRLGYDLSNAKLEAVALSLGIDKAVSSMTQAEKAELRYYAIMTQVTTAQGDMARTIDAPANQLRVLKAQVEQAGRALGNIFIPALNAVLPYAIAVMKVVRLLADAIANLFGFTLPEVDWSGISGGAGDASGAIDETTESVKKLKKSLLGIDELNLLTDNSASAGTDDDTGSQFDFELPTYDFLEGLSESRVGQIVEDMKEWLGLTGEISSWSDLMDTRFGDILETVGLIGAGFLAWKLAPELVKGVEWLKGLKPTSFTWGFGIVGATTFLADLDRLRGYIEDMNANGIDFENVVGVLSEFAGMMGDVLLMLGHLKWAGALKAVQGIGEIVSGVSDISKNGVSIDNVTTIVTGLSNLAIAVGLLTNNTKLIGGGMIGQGLTTAIEEIAENWEAIKQRDWSGVDGASLAIAAVEVLVGFLTVLDVFSKLKAKIKTPEPSPEVTTATDTVTTTTSTLTTKLTTLVKNLGLGIAVIAEVVVAAGLIIGAIWGLGLMLEQVGIAWQPVIDNAATVTIAVVTGTLLLVGIGVATAALGSAGTTLIVNMALGIAVLALIGASTALFLAEIWAIGWALEQIGLAWQPVIMNGNTIATAIGLGTALLLAIGVVCALLGSAAIASGGLLPVVIAAGTAMLLELGVATALFIAEVWAVGKGLDELGEAWQPVLDKEDTISEGIKEGTGLLITVGGVTAALGAASIVSVGLLPLAIGLGTALLIDLSAAFVELCDSLIDVVLKLTDLAVPLEDLNEDLPGLKTDMDSFTTFMEDFAEAVVAFTAVSAIAGIAATVDTVIDFFTTDPIQRMYDEVTEQTEDFEELIPALEKINPLIEKATELVGVYKTNMGSFESATGGSGGFLNSVVSGAKGVVNDLIGLFEGMANGVIKCINCIIDGLNKISVDVPEGVPLVGGMKIGFDIARISEITIPRLATGGFPHMGQMFVAREAGPELVGTIGNRTAVVNNDQIVASVSQGVYEANSEQNALLREQNALLRKLLEKDTSVTAVVGTGDVITGFERKNRRDGRTVVPVGV